MTGSQLQRVCQAAKSVANYAKGPAPHTGHPFAPLFSSSRICKGEPRPAWCLSTAIALHKRRKANAKKPKATGRMTCENMQMQMNIKSE